MTKIANLQNDMVYIDDREPKKVVNDVTTYFHTRNVRTKKQRLDCGDFFYNGILLERKDCIDWIASWRDARIINQRNKMLRESQANGYHPYVLIQGTFIQAQQQLQTIKHLQTRYSWESWLNGTLSLQEKGIDIVQLPQRTAHTQIAQVLEGLAKYKNEDKVLHDVFIEPEGLSWDMKAYQCIQGIGYTIAKELAETISIEDLLRRPKENAIKTLCTVNKVGEKKARLIYDTIHTKEKLKPIRELK